ncbi:MAG: hypothetical protein K1X81_07640 [Bacteroidia bacterium]|nr:hypothetical protein [Bacteroidia bacterium]
MSETKMTQNKTENVNSELQMWTAEVQKYLQSLEIALNSNSEAKEIYKGFFVWDSKFIDNPKVMFVGINPGTGNPNQKKEINVEPCESLSYCEYLIGENNTYTLARETANVFKELIQPNDNESLTHFFNTRCTKTNFFYLATTKETDIKPFIKLLNGLGISFHNFFEKSADFTMSLIKICKPEIVLCEGKSVFDYIVRDCYGADNTLITWKNSVGMFKDIENSITYVGYSRRYSGIRNKKELITLLKPYF